MKKRFSRWIALVLMVVMLPWQECYGAYVYGMEMSLDAELAETVQEQERNVEPDIESAEAVLGNEDETAGESAADETTSGNQEETTQETNGGGTEMAPEGGVTEPAGGQETVQEPVQDGKTDSAGLLLGLQSEEFQMEPIQLDIVNNLAEVIIREGKGIYNSHTIALVDDIEIEGGTEYICAVEGIGTVSYIDLNGYTLTINGDFYHPEGTMLFNGGSLNINGNYICEKYYLDEKGQVHEEEGVGRFVFYEDFNYINISQSFIFYSASSFSGDRLEIGGDFIAKSELYMGMDIVVHGNAVLTKKFTNVENFICKGNLEVYDGITNSGTMTVRESFLAEHGHCYFQTGSTTTIKDFIIKENDNPAYVTSRGKMFISGDLLDYSMAGQSKISTYSILEIQGNMDVGCIEFSSFDKLILSGAEQQYITVRDYGKFGTIDNQNTTGSVPIANRELDIYGQTTYNTAAYIYNNYGYVYNINLTEDTVIEGNTIIKEKCSYNFGNYDLTVTGNLIVEAGIYSGGKITVLGNLYVAKLNPNGDTFELSGTGGTWNDIEVYGDLYIKTSHMNRIHEVKLHGDLTIEEYTPRITTLTLCGEGEQIIQYNGNRQFEYDVTDFVVTNQSQEAVKLTGEPVINGTVTTNGHPIEGLLILNGGKIGDESYNGDIQVISPSSKLENVIINGDVEVKHNMILGEGVLINGNLKMILQENSSVVLNTNLAVNGNFETNVPLYVTGNSFIDIKETLNASQISVNDSTLTVNGDINVRNIVINSGALTVKNNIKATDYMVVQKDTCVSVDGNVTTGSYFNIFKEADVTIRSDINAGQAFNIIKQDNFEENAPLCFDGNITANNIQMIGSSVVIKGNVTCFVQMSISNFNDIHIDGDLTAPKISLSLNPAKTTSLYVGKTLDCDMVSSSNGVPNFCLELAGTVTVNEGLRLVQGSSLIFSGGQYQEAHLGADCYVETVIVRNTSEEGMYINQPVSCKTFTNETDCKITYGQESGRYGWTLRQDSVIYGDFNLIGGTLDLNGYNLTVKGNFCQNGGSILSTKPSAWSGGSILSIEGTYYYQPQDGSQNELTVGTMQIGGNLIQNAGMAFTTGDAYAVRLSSREEQHVNAPDASFGILELDNRSAAGIVMDATVTAKSIKVINGKQITGECVHLADGGSLTGTYPGDLTTDGRITGSINVEGTLTAAGETACSGLEINAGNLVILQPFSVQDGLLVIQKNMTVTGNGILYMDHENGNVAVGGDFTAVGKACAEATLTAGTLEIKGNFTQRKNSTFVTGGSHRTILSGRAVQSVTISDEKNSIFNILVVKKNLKTGYIFTNGNNEVYREIVYDYVDVEPPAPVGALCAKNVTTTEITIQYDAAEDDIKTLGYEIYRDGERIAVTMDLSYCDKGLTPGTEYVYEVYPYDIYNNIAAEAEKFAVRTLEDTTAPNVVDTVFVASRSKTGILIEWGVPYDDSGIAYYEIYRNGELLAGNCQETTYRDTAVELNTEYRYEVYAVDLGGNRCEQGNVVLTKPVLPRILSVTPGDGTQIGGAYADIAVVIADDNNLSAGEAAFYYRKGSEGEFLPASSEQPALLRTGAMSYRAGVCFDLLQITENGDYEIKAVVTDNDKNQTDFVFCYYIDVEAPKKVELTKAEAVSQAVQLSWEICESGDCAGYYIYRMDEESDFVKIATIKDRFETTYTDKKTDADKIYTYAVAAYDHFGTVGTWSDEKTVTVDVDGEAPVIVSLTPADGTFGNKIRMEVAAEDNIAVRRAAVYYRENETTEWKKITERYVTEGYACLEFTVDGLSEGSYEFMVKAVDGAGNESEGSIRRYTIDLTGPKKPVITQTISRNTAVQLIWDFEQENDFSHFVIERSVLGAFIPVGKEYNTLGYTVTGLTPKAQYTFRVTAYDIYGNAGEPSEEVVVTTDEDTVLPTIRIENKTKTEAVSGIVDISMTAFDDVGIKEGRVSFSYNGTTFGETITFAGSGKKEQTFTAQYQVKNGYEGKLWVRYEAEDTSGNVNETAVQEFVVDITPPDAVEEFRITSNLGSVELSWKPSKEEGVTYCLYRAEGESGVYKLLAPELDGTSYCDSGVKVYGSYSYRIEAVDLAGNKSAQTNPVLAVVSKDTVAPVVRGIGPAKSVIGTNVTLSVLATDNYRVSRVRVSCKAADGTEHLIEEFAGEKEEFYQEFLWNTDGLESGTYVICVLAWDEEGNTSAKYEKTYTLDAKAPEKPEFTAEGGHFETHVAITSSPSEDFAYYEILRRELGTEEFTRVKMTTEQKFTDTSVKPFITYIYTVKEYDKAGNSAQGGECSASADAVDVVSPRAFLPEYMSGIEGKELTFDGCMSSDNVGIARYQWNMGDGSKYTDSVVNHAYTKTGQYTVSLTVWDAAGNSDTTSAVVFVRGKSNSGNIDISVCGEDGSALAGAYVFVEPKNGESYTLQADSMGNVCLADSEGTYEISAYSAGYLPDCQTVTIRKNQDAQIQFRLIKDKVIKGSVSVRRLTIAELIEKGVDISNPANYNTFSFTLDLYFSKYPLPTKYEYINCPYLDNSESQEEQGGGPPAAFFESGGYGHSVYVQPVITEGTEQEPVYVILSITESMQWLKDIYEVSAEIVNSAGEKFTLEDMNAKIDLPDGLSFARTYQEQKTLCELGTLTSGQGKTADWLIKADKGGDYTINVSADGILMPFAAPVSALFSVKREFKADGDGLVIYIMAENCAYIGENYYVQYAVKNGTGKDLYNFTTTMGVFHYEEERTEIIVKNGPFSDGKKVSSLNGKTPQITYVLDSTECGTCTLTYGGEKYTVNVFPKDDILYGTYSCVFNAEGDPEKEYYKLVKYIMDTVGEETGVKVIMNRMPSHITKYNLRIIDLGLLFADPVDTTTGAFLERIGAAKTTGGANIAVTLDYNSMMTENCGELGTGWRHNYQERVVDRNGILYYYVTPDQRITFVSDELKQGIVYGTLLEDGTTVVVDGSIKYPGRFSTEEKGLSDYYFMRNDDGTLCLCTPDGTVKQFDGQGRLIAITDGFGKTISLRYKESETVIQDMETDSQITLVKNEEGYIQEIRDSLGNSAVLTYENGLLASYTDFAGYTVTYRYNEDNKLIEKTSVEQTVTNSYDENGRVLSQTNGNGSISFSYEDGTNYHKTTLTDYQGNRSVIETDGAYNKTAYTDALGNRTEFTYDEQGNLVRETDSLGNIKTYEYTKQGYVAKTTDETDMETTLSYDDFGNVLGVCDTVGTATFTYDDKNRLTRAAYVNGRVRTYTYDENGNLAEDAIEGLGSVKYRYENGRLAGVTDTLGNTTVMNYDAAGNVLSQTDAGKNTVTYSYDLMGRTKTVTNPLGETLRFEYDYSGNITKTIYPDGTYTASTYDVNNSAVSTTDRAGNTTTYVRDSYGRLLKQENPDGTFETYAYDALGNETSHTDILGRTTTYAYDSASRLISKQDADGRTTTFEYYNNGKLKKQTESDGTWESYAYDTFGNLTEKATLLGTTRYTYDVMGNMTSVTNPLGVTTTYTYDKYDRLISETDGNSNTTTYAYNAAGNCIGKTLPDKTHVKMTYDALGRMTSVSTVTSSYGEVSVRYEYDALGRVTKLTDERGETTTYEYDAYGNVTAVYDGTKTLQAAYTYDVFGNVLTETDAAGTVTQGNYDTRTGRLVSMIHNVNTVNEAAYAYTYDTAGRLISVTDPLSGTSSYTYDNHTGNIASLTDPNGGTTTYTYDPTGRITEICNAVGSASRYTYDENGLLTQSQNARGQNTDYTYDTLDRISSFTDEAGSVKYFYDNNGNILSVTETLPDGTTRTITRTYDCMNRVSAYTDYKGNTIRYGYDELGNLITLTYAGGEIVRYAYYPNGLLKSVTDVKGNITSYEYDSKGNVTKTVNADGTVEVRSYNGSNKLTVQETKNAVGEVLSRYEYTYDENGNVTKTTGIESGDIGKVTEAEYKYDASNRLISYNGKEVQYDKDGNMIYGPLDGKMAQYEYDCRNRLVKAGDTEYEYDAENNRIAVETEEYREEYVVNTNAELSQVLTATRYEKISGRGGSGDSNSVKVTSDTGTVTVYTYGNGLVSQYTEEVGTEYYHYNNIGSTMYLTKNGVKTHEFAYSIYGELTLDEYGEVRFLYNGQLGVMTDENSLYYMRARYYNSEIRRFINQDIVTGSIENSQSLNRYAYCQGNPVNYFDPFGLEPCEFFTGLGHGMLNLMGLIPGIGDVFDITNAIWYALDGNWGRCFESGIAALPFIGNLLPDRRTCDYVRRVLNIASYGGTAVLAGQGMVDGGQALWADISSGQCSGWSIFLGVANIGLNGATLFFSGKSFVSETKDLNKMLKADIKSNSSSNKYKKASIWERVFKRTANVNELHPNPLDEFSNPKIGPSDLAVSKYIRKINETGKISEPIIVQKLSTGGYEIINGHHRWLAAIKRGLENVPIKIKNYKN